MDPSKSVLAIVNPKAGTLKNKTGLLEKLVSVFENGHFPFSNFDFQESKGPGHATELARNAANSGLGLCLAMGGDGTMNEVATGLLNSQTPLGIIPLGSGNGLARHLGISMDPVKAFDEMLAGKKFLMDTGEANGNPYFLAAGIGFEGVVAHAFAKQSTRGFSQYILSSAKAYFQYQPIEIECETNEASRLEKIFTSTFANGNQYGNRARISPGSSLHDGWLNHARVFPFPFWQGLPIFFNLMNGRLKNGPYYQNDLFKNLVVRSGVEMKGHVDGEPVNFGMKLEIKIKPASLWVQLPSKTTIW